MRTTPEAGSPFDETPESLIDLNYDLANRQWRQLERISGRWRWGIAEGLARLLFFAVRSLRFWRLPQRTGAVLFLVGSRNHARSLEPIAARLEGALILGFHREPGRDGHIPEARFYLGGLAQFFNVMRSYRRCHSSYIRWTMRKRLDRYVLAAGATAAWATVFNRLRPRVVVFSNDHSVWTRAAMAAAKTQGIATVYIPHAPVGEGFPPLAMAYACLDGAHQLARYERAEATVALTGAVRYEPLVTTAGAPGDGVLVCFNKLDALPWAETVLGRIRKQTQERVRIRPHPADEHRYGRFRAMAQRHGCEFIGGEAPFFEAVDGVGYVCAGVSGVHVDAVMAGRVPVTYADWYTGDYYGLKELGLLHEIDPETPLRQLDREGLDAAAQRLNRHLAHPDLPPSALNAQIIDAIASGHGLDNLSGSTDNEERQFRLRFDDGVEAYVAQEG